MKNQHEHDATTYYYLAISILTTITSQKTLMLNIHQLSQPQKLFHGIRMRTGNRIDGADVRIEWTY